MLFSFFNILSAVYLNDIIKSHQERPMSCVFNQKPWGSIGQGEGYSRPRQLEKDAQPTDTERKETPQEYRLRRRELKQASEERAQEAENRAQERANRRILELRPELSFLSYAAKQSFLERHDQDGARKRNEGASERYFKEEEKKQREMANTIKRAERISGGSISSYKGHETALKIIEDNKQQQQQKQARISQEREENARWCTRYDAMMDAKYEKGREKAQEFKDRIDRRGVSAATEKDRRDYGIASKIARGGYNKYVTGTSSAYPWQTK